MTTETVVHADLEHGSGAAPVTAAWLTDLIAGARDLFTTTSVVGTLDAVVVLARRAFGADGVGVSWSEPWSPAVRAASGALARRAETLQVECHQGPAFQAMKSRQPVISTRLGLDQRWRFWAPQAADLGFCSVLSLQLVSTVPRGAVTLYSSRPSFFRSGALAPGLWFAQQASIAISVAGQRERLLRSVRLFGAITTARGFDHGC